MLRKFLKEPGAKEFFGKLRFRQPARPVAHACFYFFAGRSDPCSARWNRHKIHFMHRSNEAAKTQPVIVLLVGAIDVELSKDAEPGSRQNLLQFGVAEVFVQPAIAIDEFVYCGILESGKREATVLLENRDDLCEIR